ncbi:MAG: hypothetical protein Q4D02_05605 [Clostridia bacterium]|nr:hypothetical protein [Clostridia bacterium]
MVNEKYLFAAQNLVDRNKNRLDTKQNPKEKEVDELFYWVLSRLEWSMQNCFPARESHSITIKAGIHYDDGRILLEHGRVAEYLSQYVKGEAFYEVVQEVCNAFNEIGKSGKNRYYFEATCMIPKCNDKDVEFKVYMFTKK